MIVGAGGIAAIYYANRMIQFPLGVFGYALIIGGLAVLIQTCPRRGHGTFRSTLLFALRNLMLVLVPTAIGMVIFSKWIIHIVFQRGAFDAYSTSVTSQVMFYAALGLPFFGASRILVSAFYALHDTKTPVKAATVCLVDQRGIKRGPDVPHEDRRHRLSQQHRRRRQLPLAVARAK